MWLSFPMGFKVLTKTGGTITPSNEGDESRNEKDDRLDLSIGYAFHQRDGAGREYAPADAAGRKRTAPGNAERAEARQPAGRRHGRPRRAERLVPGTSESTWNRPIISAMRISINSTF